MRILITNDDGIDSVGIKALVERFSKKHDVFVIAPDSQRSAAGHSITISRPIVVRELTDWYGCVKAFCIDGTPADCVKLGIEKLCGEHPIDMVVSGINHGTNLGSDVIYSGTVSAAIEGVICGVPSFAVSLDIRGDVYDYTIAASYAYRIVMNAINKGMNAGMVLNINVPALAVDAIRGIKISKLGNRIYQNAYLETTLENNQRGFRITGIPKYQEIPDTDTYDIRQGYVTVTPLHYDLTSYKLMNMVNEWFEGGYKTEDQTEDTE